MISYPLRRKNRIRLTSSSTIIFHRMKKDIHPTYFPEAKIVCACGHVFAVGATKQTMEVEICSHCHPFYTGKEKLVDTAGRVEKYQTKVKKSSALKASVPAQHATRARKEQKSSKQILRAAPKTESARRAPKASKADAK